MNTQELVDIIHGELPHDAQAQKTERISRVLASLEQRGFVQGGIPLRPGEGVSRGAYHGPEKDGVVVYIDSHPVEPRKMSDFVFVGVELLIQRFGQPLEQNPILPDSRVYLRTRNTSGITFYSFDLEVPLVDPTRTADIIVRKVADLAEHLTPEYKAFRAQFHKAPSK